MSEQMAGQPMGVTRIEHDPSALTAEVRDRIMQAVTSGGLGPGDRLILDTLAEQLGVSRTPVRDALQRLMSEGIVEPRGKRGYVIRELSPADIENNIDARLAVETYAAARLAEKGGAAIASVQATLQGLATQPLDTVQASFEANRTVHRAIVEAAGNPQLVAFFDMTWGQAVSGRIYFDFLQRQSDQRFVQDHEELIAAIAHGDPDAARAAMRDHIRHGQAHA